MYIGSDSSQPHGITLAAGTVDLEKRFVVSVDVTNNGEWVGGHSSETVSVFASPKLMAIIGATGSMLWVLREFQPLLMIHSKTFKSTTGILFVFLVLRVAPLGCFKVGGGGQILLSAPSKSS